MNWGYRIAILYTAFALFIIVLVVKSMNQNFDLVADNYYDKELKFQGQIDKESLVNAEGMQVTWEQKNNELFLKFPSKSGVTGEVTLFRPSDASKDFSVVLKPDSEGIQQIDIRKAIKGKYLLQIDWKEKGKAYFQENEIIL